MLAICCAVCSACFPAPADAAIVTYIADNSNFANPERGFYIQTDPSPGGLQQARSNSMTVIRTYYRIDAYRNSDLPQSVLDKFSSDMGIVRQAGAKIIPRFSYNFSMDDPDAPLTWILRHIEQITPLLRANADVIAFMEAGFIGAWGEWHSSKNGLDNTTSRRQVLFALLDALPVDRMVALRYNYHKRAIYGSDTPLGPDSAFSGSNRARTGAHADCLGASVEDWGTYDPSDAASIEMQKNYLNLDNRYLPQGGETCNPSSYSTCTPMLIDLQRMRWDVINNDYHSDVLDSWVSGGCMDQIRRNLGYRLRMINSDAPSSLAAGNSFTLSIQMVNDGWGKMYNPRAVEVILRNQSGGAKYILNIDNGKGNRLWLPGAGETKTLSMTGGIPQSMPSGSYDVILNLPDPYPSIRERPEYSIRLANTGVWESTTGFNKLSHTLSVSVSGGGNAYTGSNWFALNGVIADAPPTITGPASLNGGSAGSLYTATFTASGTAPITWSVSGGALPEGMTLNAGTGVYSGTPTTAGTYTFIVRATNSLGNDTKNCSHVIATVVTASQGPFGGTARAVPGTIQAEDYDVGGEGIAYHDLVAGNELGAYRTDSVDIEATTDVDGGYQIGYSGDGEWLEYTVNVAATGSYSVDARVASANAMQFHLYVDGADVATVDAPATGTGWTTWTTVRKSGISLTAGQHVLRFAFSSPGFCLNWLRFTETATIRSYFSGKPEPLTAGNSAFYALNGRQLTHTSHMAGSRIGMVIRQTLINGRVVTEKMMIAR